jgi:hypothetical protein
MRIPKFRLFLVLLLLAAVVAGWRGVYPVPLKTAFGGGGEQVTDTSILDNYAVEFELTADGALTSTELLDVEFTQYGKHGIYRIFDTQDAQYSNVQHPVDVLKVDRKEGGNWIPEPYEVTQNGGGTMTIRIGSPYRTFEPGTSGTASSRQPTTRSPSPKKDRKAPPPSGTGTWSDPAGRCPCALCR